MHIYNIVLIQQLNNFLPVTSFCLHVDYVNIHKQIFFNFSNKIVIVTWRDKCVKKPLSKMYLNQPLVDKSIWSCLCSAFAVKIRLFSRISKLNLPISTLNFYFLVMTFSLSSLICHLIAIDV